MPLKKFMLSEGHFTLHEADLGSIPGAPYGLGSILGAPYVPLSMPGLIPKLSPEQLQV